MQPSRRGDNNGHWKGGRVRLSGYVGLRRLGHPKGGATGYQYEHRAVVEEVLGHPLRASAPVHHVNGDRGDNSHSNLIACHDDAYHKLIEGRTAALRACGHADWRKCWICQVWAAPDDLYVPPNDRSPMHAACHAQQHREYMRRRKVV